MQDFQTIAHLIPNFGDRVNNPPAPVQEQEIIRAIFQDLLGQSASFILPVLFRSGQLVIYAEAAIWGQHIRHRQTTLLDLCQSAGLRVNDIKVKVQADACGIKRGKPESPASYKPEAAIAHIEKLAEQTEQPELKTTLHRLAARIRENHSTEN